MDNNHDAPTPDFWTDVENFQNSARITNLRCSPDGQRLIVAIAAADNKKNQFVDHLWSLASDGGSPTQLTNAPTGETLVAITRTGDVLFSSERPTAADGGGSIEKTLWSLPALGGEARNVASVVGGWSDVIVSKTCDDALLVLHRMNRAADAKDDAELRTLRKEQGLSAILHSSYPVRFWDHDLPAQHDVLARASRNDDGSFSDKFEYVNIEQLPGQIVATVASDDLAQVVVETQTVMAGAALRHKVLHLVDGEFQDVCPDQRAQNDVSIGSLSSDGRWLCLTVRQDSTATECPDTWLELIDLSTGEHRELCQNWDRWPSVVGVSNDGSTIYVTADDDGHSPVFSVDVATDQVTRLTHDGAWTMPVLSPDRETLYALRSGLDNPGEIVRLDLASGDVTVLWRPDVPELPGTLFRVETTAADGQRVAGWLATPSGDGPHPMLVWIHGGPLDSWKAWSWRWCPWLMVAKGYAVLMPDPALSTGYGREFIQRGWGRWGSEPYTDIMALTDEAERRSDIDPQHTAAMGGSFGGYMANWVATQTDRFLAIITHASLWNLDAFGAATDMTTYWHREMTPQMTKANSPHNFVEQITTPMLVIHGDKDYRVPIGEGLSLWSSLNETYEGDPEQIPHRFLYFPDENHWILKPNHAVLWYQTVTAFLDWHVHQKPFEAPRGL